MVENAILIILLVMAFRGVLPGNWVLTFILYFGIGAVLGLCDLNLNSWEFYFIIVSVFLIQAIEHFSKD